MRQQNFSFKTIVLFVENTAKKNLPWKILHVLKIESQ